MHTPNVRTRKSKIALRRFEARMSHLRGERHNITSVPQIFKCVLMTEIVRGEAFQPGFLGVPSQLDAPCMCAPRRTVGRAEDRSVGAPFFRADCDEFFQNGDGVFGEEDGSCLARLCSGGPNDGVSSVDVYICGA